MRTTNSLKRHLVHAIKQWLVGFKKKKKYTSLRRPCPSLHLVVPLLLKTLLEAPDSLPQGVNVSVEHRDGHRGLVWLCTDAAASPEDAQTHSHCLYSPHAGESRCKLMRQTEPLTDLHLWICCSIECMYVYLCNT